MGRKCSSPRIAAGTARSGGSPTCPDSARVERGQLLPELTREQARRRLARVRVPAGVDRLEERAPHDHAFRLAAIPLQGRLEPDAEPEAARNRRQLAASREERYDG